MKEFLVWFFVGDNPFRLLGFWPAMVWMGPLILGIGLYFTFWEIAGGYHWHGAVQLSPFLRCIPPVYWLAFFGWFIQHILRHRP